MLNRSQVLWESSSSISTHFKRAGFASLKGTASSSPVKPNHSIERMSNRLRRSPTAHVKR